MNLPNKLTIARIIAVPFYILFHLTGHYIIALILFILAAVTDYFDGMIARKYKLTTNFGKIMDPLADKILVYSAFCIFVAQGIVPPWMFAIILAREFLVAGVRTVAASEGIVIAADMSGKIKTVLQMIAVPLLLLGLATGEAVVSVSSGGGNAQPPENKIMLIGNIILWASVIMTVVSGFEYVYKNKEIFKK